MQARARFKVESWDESPVLEPGGGAKLTRASVSGSYTGDIEGESRSESVMWYATDGSATYASFEHVTGRIGDRSGSFVLHGTGSYDGTEARWEIEIVAGSGTGGLEGIAGEGRAVAPPGSEADVELDIRFG